MALIDDLLRLGFDYTQAQNLSDQIQQFGTEAQTKAEEIGTQAYEAMQFKPFTVTSGVGGVTTTADGSTALQLTPEQQALRDTLFGGSQALAGQATAAYDPIYAQIAQQAYGGVSPLLTQAQTAAEAAGAMDRGAREQQVYGQLRALQSPEEERQRLALENRLAAQGRLGTQTAQFGGTPEGLALAKAQAEAQNQAALMAMQQSGVEQQQAIARAQGLQGLAGGMFGMGSQAQMTPRQIQAADLQNLAGMMTSGYAPERELLNQLQAGTNIASLADVARRQSAIERSETRMTGLEAALEAEKARAGLMGQAMASAGQVIGGGMGQGGLFSSIVGAVPGSSSLPQWLKDILGI
jgi:hypothetical protein